jgi:hypothetical protein
LFQVRLQKPRLDKFKVAEEKMIRFTDCCQDVWERNVNQFMSVLKRFDEIQLAAAEKSQPMSLSKINITQDKQAEIMERLDALAEQVGKQTKMLDKLMKQRSLTSEEDSFSILTGEEEAQEAKTMSSDSVFAEF